MKPRYTIFKWPLEHDSSGEHYKLRNKWDKYGWNKDTLKEMTSFKDPRTGKQTNLVDTEGVGLTNLKQLQRQIVDKTAEGDLSDLDRKKYIQMYKYLDSNRKLHTTGCNKHTNEADCVNYGATGSLGGNDLLHPCDWKPIGSAYKANSNRESAVTSTKPPCVPNYMEDPLDVWHKRLDAEEMREHNNKWAEKRVKRQGPRRVAFLERHSERKKRAEQKKKEGVIKILEASNRLTDAAYLRAIKEDFSWGKCIGCEYKVKEALTCSVNLSHKLCQECMPNAIRGINDPESTSYNADGRVICREGCGGEFPLEGFIPYVDRETFSKLLDRRKDGMRNQVRRELASERNDIVSELELVISADSCPKCNTKYLGFDGCAALSCGNANCRDEDGQPTQFCAYCTVFYGNRTAVHDHVRICDMRPPTQRDPYYIDDQNAFQRLRKEQRRPRVKEYLNAQTANNLEFIFNNRVCMTALETMELTLRKDADAIVVVDTRIQNDQQDHIPEDLVDGPEND